MSSKTHPSRALPIIRTRIESEGDVVAARQRALRLAELIGFERRDQTRVATAVSELARNAFNYAGKGEVEFSIELDPSPQIFLVRISDSGPGIKDLESVLSGDYQSPTGMGLGLIGARRLMDKFDIATEIDKGTTVTVGMKLSPRMERISPTRLARIAESLAKDGDVDPLIALREQNRELIQALEDIRRREEESKELNQELGDTESRRRRSLRRTRRARGAIAQGQRP